MSGLVLHGNLTDSAYISSLAFVKPPVDSREPPYFRQYPNNDRLQFSPARLLHHNSQAYPPRATFEPSSASSVRTPISTPTD
jgi:hypothetical protein